jgi:outer membrane receptor protein involved in Fe transport
MRYSKIRTLLLAGCAGVALSPAFALAQSQPQPRMSYDIPAQDLGAALTQFGQQSEREIVFSADLARNKKARAVAGEMTSTEALAMLLGDTGLTYRTSSNGSIIVEASDPQSGSAAGDGADGTVQALIVTAQKKEEAIQDVPIAISAFTEKTLEEQKIEGGFDLLKAIPNVTFSKNNFTSYNFSIRGIGTKAVSATTDPGVAVSFNNIALLQNRLFEQEYFDVERVEVLRGPQGTLYGRNATAGVINVISAKPNLQEFSGSLKGEVGNYHTKRVSAMLNAPLIQGKFGVRFAGSLTERQGYDYNEVTKNHINGRDLWSARLTIGFNPTPQIRTNLIWERFNEDDNRSRTGKQLCRHDEGPDSVGGVSVAGTPGPWDYTPLRKALFSQGCKAGGLYDDSAFGTPNGLALPFVFGMLALGDGPGAVWSLGADSTGTGRTLVRMTDPYGGMMQSRDLRTIASIRDPRYRAKADLFELNADIDITDHLRLSSQTAYDADQVYSFQDFNRFNTLPIFTDTAKLSDGESPYANLAPGGVFCDPQVGCSSSLVGFDISRAKARQFSQELRLQSDFDGPLNFSIGANYTRFQVLVDYYVMYNLISAFALIPPFNYPATGMTDLTHCGWGTTVIPNITDVDINTPGAACPYIDPNPVESINGEGHNYFRSKNPYKLKSGAAFGEFYWQARPDLKVTAGLRYTDDRKSFIPVPSQILLAPSLFAGGAVNRGYPERPAIEQHWGEWTGRLGFDLTPEVSFTDRTMVYAFYSRGYKGGGANPPKPGFATIPELTRISLASGLDQATVDSFIQYGLFPILELTSAEYSDTFKPEFVNAFEVGAKNTLLGGALTFNTDAFFYDYKDYQVSQIRDRTAVNENFDARIWGLEFETAFAPSRNFSLIANLGYLNTRIADGETSIDIMNRTQSDPNYTLVKPWVQLPSNCVVPTEAAKAFLQSNDMLVGFWGLCGGYNALGSGFQWTDPATGLPYDVNNYPQLNGGAGVKARLGGNELPNSPHWTMNIGAQYGHDILDGSWRATVRADAYWQSQSWARVYNDDPYDKLHGWYNVNLSVWFERPDDDLKIELYAKNILDKTPITDAFLNSDDTALTTNVFVLDPRLIGLSIKKGF